MEIAQQNSDTDLTTRRGEHLPSIVQRAGRPAAIAWDDFFSGVIANDLTRKAYDRAVRAFLQSPIVSGKHLHQVTPGDVGEYLRLMTGGLPKKKQHHSALRAFFNLLVERHICLLNPASVARTERLEVSDGKTPRITVVQAKRLLDSIAPETTAGKRDRAIIGILMWTGVRAGSVAKLRRGDLSTSDDGWSLRFDEKRRRTRDIPVRYELRTMLSQYLAASGNVHAPKTSPLFPTSTGRGTRLTSTPMTGHDICRMVKRRMDAACLPTNLSPHSFRVAVATDLLEQNVPLSDVQYLLGHADPRTTRLYDRRQKEVTRNIVERIRL